MDIVLACFYVYHNYISLIASISLKVKWWYTVSSTILKVAFQPSGWRNDAQRKKIFHTFPTLWLCYLIQTKLAASDQMDKKPCEGIQYLSLREKDALLRRLRLKCNTKNNINNTNNSTNILSI